MRKSIVLVTLAALTAALAMGCASSGEAMPAGPLTPRVASDYIVRTPLAKDVAPAPRSAAPAAAVSQLPRQRERATAALVRPTRPTDR